jgi:2-polyprenyl-3-methyl-5-hydroxy-6-metoxy-1,4-benzoquinol methylase
MRRTIEKLSQQRKEKQDALAKEIEGLKKQSQELSSSDNTIRLQHLLSRMQELVSTKDISPDTFGQQVSHTLAEFQKILDKNIAQTQDLFLSFASLIEANIALMDAKDKEWDALGSNHVGMIFKSMEWRVDKLAVVYEDVNLLMKKFLLLKEQLDRLLGVLEEKNLPTQKQVQEILEPLKDWHYAAFENRHRGNEEEVKKQQSQFLPYFLEKGNVLDLGCGRGEFLDLCRDNGIETQGIDLNEQMVAICKDKGLNCQKGDILESLAERPDKTLGGIFSSQVIEHLSPAQLKKLIELAYFKLAPGGHIVLETINPASVFALVQIYFLDLTHQKPIHPQTLKFLLESSGFEDVEIMYSHPLEQEQLQTLPCADETASILNRNIDNLNRLLYAPPNYSAIGLKK